MTTKRWKVLLADDVELFLELEKTFLQREDVELIVARDGRTALETIRRERPDLILLDLYMPGMDGHDVCRAVKGDPDLRATPVLIVTSGGHEHERLNCQQAGCDAILTKPINRHSFLSAVRGHLRIIEREAHRVPARLPVHFSTADGQVHDGYSTVNLSTGGIFIETDDVLATGEPVQVWFALPDRPEEMRCRARVAWINSADRHPKPMLPPGIGVEFLDSSDGQRAELLAFVKKQLLSPLW